MAAHFPATHDAAYKEKEMSPGAVPEQRSEEVDSVHSGEDILGKQALDPVLNKKMHLVNNAIDEIGFTPYHFKLFFLNGFGYAVDSLVLLLQSVVYQSAYREFGERGYKTAMNISVYVGMLVGALFWGMSADIIGRRWAFNCSLFICAAATLIAGAMPNWGSLGFFIAIIGFGAGGNLVMDTTVFLEYLPGKSQWLLTAMAAWWGIGQAITGFIAWGFMVDEKWNCATVDTCTRENNMGWRYVMFTSGALVFVMSLLRITVVRLRETPKYLLAAGEDEEVIKTLQYIANKHSRQCSLTLEQLTACGPIRNIHRDSRFSFGETLVHLRGLFATRQIGISTSMIWLSWTLIGLAYPLFYVFLNTYLATHGADFSVTPYESWRNYALTNVSGVPGPLLAALLCEVPFLGRRYTMTIGALMTSVFFFAFTAVRTSDQNVGFGCAVAFCTNIYYGTLYAYTPEVLPSAHRATGNGVSVAFNRIMGILSAVIADTADKSTSAPIYLCAALFIAMAIVSALFPFEPYGRRSS